MAAQSTPSTPDRPDDPPVPEGIAPPPSDDPAEVRRRQIERGVYERRTGPDKAAEAEQSKRPD